MKILTVIANPNPKSFCHALLDRFNAGLNEAGHTNEVVDLYAIHFDPVFGPADFNSYVHESIPSAILEQMNLKQRILEAVHNPVQRFFARRWLRNQDLPAVAKFIHEHRPKDVIEQWEKVQQAQALAFIAPVFWLGFPAILKGWFERVFALGDAYTLAPEGWQGQVKGRVPLLHHKKALIMSTTMFSEADYAAEWQAPMRRIIDDWSLHYPGVEKVEHIYFYSVPVVDSDTRQRYLEQAYSLGRIFAEEQQEQQPTLAGYTSDLQRQSRIGTPTLVAFS